MKLAIPKNKYHKGVSFATCFCYETNTVAMQSVDDCRRPMDDYLAVGLHCVSHHLSAPSRSRGALTQVESCLAVLRSCGASYWLGFCMYLSFLPNHPDAHLFLQLLTTPPRPAFPHHSSTPAFLINLQSPESYLAAVSYCYINSQSWSI